MTGKAADAVLLLDHSAELGGGELSLLDYARSTSRAVRVIVFEPGPFVDLLARSGIPVAVIAAGAMLEVRRDNGLRKVLVIVPSLMRSIAALGRAMRRAPVVYANSQKALVVAALANAAIRRPLIWHLHDIMTAAHFSGLMRRVAIGLSNRFVTHVIANSQATVSSYRAAGGRLPVTVVHNGIDPGPFQKNDRPVLRDALVRDLGISSDTSNGPIVAVFGRLSAWKGQDVAIAAIAAVSDARLILVGAAMFGDSAFETTLRDQVRTQGIEDRVHFLGFRTDIAPLMASVDVIVHASTAPEPFGRVIAEAMMAGTPVIATAAGGALEIVEDGVSGLLVPPGEPMALAAAIRRLIANPEAAAALAARGRDVAETRFSLVAAVRRTDAVIDRVAASARMPA
jgi:glycosyltransferase involved in cell wall biosynthesis